MQAEHSLEEKKRAGDPVDRFDAAHLQITGNTYGSGMSIGYLDLSNYCFLRLNASASITFARTWVFFME